MNTNPDRVDSLVRSVLAVDPSAEFEAGIRKRVRQEAVGRRTGPRRAVLLSSFAAAIAMVFMFAGQQHELRVRPGSSALSVRDVPSDTEMPIASVEPGKPNAVRSDKERTAIVAPAPDVTVPEALAEAAIDSPLAPDALPRLRLQEFVLKTSLEPVPLTPLASAQDLPQFEISQFSLTDSKNGVAE
jgi:hypothetical protein